MAIFPTSAHDLLPCHFVWQFQIPVFYNNAYNIQIEPTLEFYFDIACYIYISLLDSIYNMPTHHPDL